ncbi:CAP domain-containing protein [Demequina aestuarii]|uniref:CAP domain-containing protein n=1 Tax=Demequina aestuarii TaxID=327095 RepID=UPI000783D3DB|nr:CAP domain-containing protein [Demequina aestuarii]
MSSQQESPGDERRGRRPLTAFLLASVPLVLAGVGGTVAANLAPDTITTPATAPVEESAQEVAAVERTTDVLPAVVAPQIAADTTTVPQISVSFAPEPEPAPAPVARSGAGRSGGGSSSTGSGSTAASSGSASKPAPRQTSDSYCASPSSPYSAGGSVKGLLTAANKERARIGVGAMSWSGSLASAANSWSQAMAGRDDSGSGSALAHNPNRPGAENVAVSGSSGGMSMGTAINKAHAGWMYSGGHCRNIMNPSYSTMGAGAASTANGNAVYTTANFR